MAKYSDLASFIIKNVGGKDNIVSINHCMTRLRITLKDKSLADTKTLEGNKGIISCQEAEGKLQVIIGTHVGDVYQEIIEQTGKEKKAIEEKTKGSVINRFASTITKIVVPALGVLMACGIISGLNSVLTATGLVEVGSGTNIILNAMGNACLTFFPVILGYTSAVAFGLDPFVGIILGSILIFPNIAVDMNAGDVMFTIFEGTPFAMPVYKTFFEIPVIFPTNGYTSTLIPIMLINFFASKFERSLKNHLPAVTQQFMVPFITILIAGAVGVLAIGPISMLIQNGLQAMLQWLIGVSSILAFAVITLIYQPLVIFGLHWPLITLGLMEFAAGSTLIVASIFPASFTHMAACLAVFLRTKSTKMKNIALPAFLSACFCIIEPSIYGVTLPVKKRFAFCMLGGLVGGLILTIANAPMYAISMGTTGIMAFVDPNTGSFNGLVWCIIACLAAMIVTFALTWITYKPGEDGPNEDDTVYESKRNITHKKEVISAPVKGKIVSLKDMSDDAFSSGKLGKGICIIPEDDQIIAPCDGTISALYPTGHAVCIKSPTGVEIMIHVGVDTFDAKAELFTKLKKQGDAVKRGDPLIKIDLKKMKELGLSTETAVIVLNSSDYLDVINTGKDRVLPEDDLLTMVMSAA